MSAQPHVVELRVTPLALEDPPLLNSTGVHEPYALRSVVEVHMSDGRVGLGETYGDRRTLRDLALAADALPGLDPFDLNGLAGRVRAALRTPTDDGSDDRGSGGDPSAGAETSAADERAFACVYGAIEVALLDVQGKILGRPVCDLLGGAVRAEVPYSAYLFFKFGRHRDVPAGYGGDAWGEVLAPDAIVQEARTMIERYGFRSIKLKGGVLEPDAEIESIRRLRDAFPDHPLRIDPNACWTVETSVRVGRALAGELEYLEDPTPGLEGMAAVATRVEAPLATNMVVTAFSHLPTAVRLGSVGVVLADHHYWGGLRATQRLAGICATWGLGLSMHSNSHLGISLAAMTQVAAATPNLAYACDTHYPWQTEDVLAGGPIRFEGGSVRVSREPGLGVELDRDAMARLHRRYLECGIRERDDIREMKKYRPEWTGRIPRF